MSSTRLYVQNSISSQNFTDNSFGPDSFKDEYPELTLLQDWTFKNIEEWEERPTAVFLQTPTASGKTLAVSGAIFNRLRESTTRKRAAFLYPFRALNEDQQSQLREYGSLFGFTKEDFCVYQGGVGREKLREIQRNQNFLLATPDKIIYMIGGGRESRAEFTRLLNQYRYLMFDEVHTYSGLMLWATVYFIKLWKIIAEKGSTLTPPTLFFVTATLTEEVKEFLVGKLSDLGYEIVFSPEEYSKSLGGDWEVMLRGTQMHQKEVPSVVEKGGVLISNSAWKAKATMEQCIESDKIGEEEGLLYIGQDKFEESFRKENLLSFRERPNDYIFFTSPAAEAGVDFSTDLLVTEETIASSMIQRIGRAGRGSEEAKIIVYSPTLTEYFEKEGIEKIEREEFERRIKDVLSEKKLVTDVPFFGIAAYPFLDILERSALLVDEDNFLEESHREIISDMKSSGKKARTFFRSFVPYMKYTSGEGISFSSLCRRELELRENKYGLEVFGRPDPDRYYSSKRPDHQEVQVGVENVWLDRKITLENEDIVLLFGEFSFCFPETGGSSKEVTETSLVWFAPENVPKHLNKQFDICVQGYNTFPGGFVDEDFWGLANE